MLRKVVVVLALLSCISWSYSFQVGVNLPWKNYGTDFGSNNWGYSGVASNPSAIDNFFASASAHNAKVIRFWLFSDARAGITIDGSGYPTGLNSHVFNDIDAVIQSAHNHGVSVVFVLFDFLLANWYSINNGVQMGGRTSWITDPAQTSALVNNVINPVVQRYAGESAIAAWEIMNEPEWIIYDLPQPTVDTSKVNAVSLAQFYNFASAISNAIHSQSSRPVTLGSATLKWHVIWTDSFAQSKGFTPLHLDFYQTHYYSWMDHNNINDPILGTFSQSPIDQSYSALGLDKPMFVGEFGSSYSLTSNLDAFLANGYAGTWVWSVNADYAMDANVYSMLANWGASHIPIAPVQPAQNPSATNNNNGDGLSNGSIAGIAIGAAAVVLGVILVLALIALVVALVVIRRKRRRNMQALHYVHMQDEDEAMADKL